MELNITHTNSFQFENREYLRNRAKDILNKKENSSEKIEKIIDKTLFSELNNSHRDSQLAMIRASLQINNNNALKETLKYINSKPKNIKKKPVLGEIWEIFSQSEVEKEYEEVFTPIIDENLENIFAA